MEVSKADWDSGLQVSTAYGDQSRDIGEGSDFEVTYFIMINQSTLTETQIKPVLLVKLISATRGIQVIDPVRCNSQADW